VGIQTIRYVRIKQKQTKHTHTHTRTRTRTRTRTQTVVVMDQIIRIVPAFLYETHDLPLQPLHSKQLVRQSVGLGTNARVAYCYCADAGADDGS